MFEFIAGGQVNTQVYVAQMAGGCKKAGCNVSFMHQQP